MGPDYVMSGKYNYNNCLLWFQTVFYRNEDARESFIDLAALRRNLWRQSRTASIRPVSKMAPPESSFGRRVIAKTAWKSVLPKSGPIADPLDKTKSLEFSGFEVLTDYSLVEEERSPTTKVSKLGKRKKQKFKSVSDEENVQLPEFEIETKKENEGKVSKLGKRKKQKFKSVEGEENAQLPEFEVKTKKKKKGNEGNVQKKVEEKLGNKSKKMPYDKMNMPRTSNEPETSESQSTVDMSAWKGLGVPEQVLRVLTEQKFTKPTQIQRLSLPPSIREKKDILGAAETGSGKTLAFGIPIIHHILNDKKEELAGSLEKDDEPITLEIEERTEEAQESDFEDDTYDEGKIGCVRVINDVEFPFSVPNVPLTSHATRNGPLRALILTPTRELAIQIKNHLMFAAKYTDIKIAVVLGGMAVEKQLRILKGCPDIVVATPGRLWELIEEGEPHLSKAPQAKYLVIDEADRMLEKGHFEELERLLDLINENDHKCEERQTFVFSATLTLVHDAPRRSKPRVNKYTVTEKQKLEQLMEVIGLRENPKVIDVTLKTATAEGLIESRIHCAINEKDYYLYYFLAKYPGRTLVFCNSIDCIRRLENIFKLLKQKMWPLHASMPQKQRLKNLERFSASDVGVLLATDVAARGLDIPNILHVVHYQVPRTSESYVHRSGRTARAACQGLSVMLIEPNEMSIYKNLCWTLKKDFNQPLFPVDIKYMPQIKTRVQTALQLDKLLHHQRTFEAKSSWFQQTAKECDMELDDDEFARDYGDDRQKSIERKEIKFMERELESILKQPLLPIGVSAKTLTVPDMANLAPKKSDSAIEMVKKDAKVQREMMDRISRDNQKRKKVRLGKQKKKKFGKDKK